MENIESTGNFISESFMFLKQIITLIKDDKVTAIKYQQSLSEILPSLLNEVQIFSDDTIGKDETSVPLT